MLQATQTMARASRQIVTELNKYADTANVQGFLIPAHVYMCDYMIIKYNQTAVINVIRAHIAKIPPNRREYKHFTPLYWYKVVDNMLGDKSVHRNQDIQVYGEMIDYNSFNHITKMFLLEDYSVQDAITINRIVNTCDLADIISACKTASQNGVHSMAYVDAILRDINARKRAEAIRIKVLGDKIEESSKTLEGETHAHTAMELAKSEYDYNKKREDMLLELLVDKMFGGSVK